MAGEETHSDSKGDKKAYAKGDKKAYDDNRII
jgi:hypothetical protein